MRLVVSRLHFGFWCLGVCVVSSYLQPWCHRKFVCGPGVPHVHPPWQLHKKLMSCFISVFSELNLFGSSGSPLRNRGVRHWMADGLLVWRPAVLWGRRHWRRGRVLLWNSGGHWPGWCKSLIIKVVNVRQYLHRLNRNQALASYGARQPRLKIAGCLWFLISQIWSHFIKCIGSGNGLLLDGTKLLYLNQWWFIVKTQYVAIIWW